MDKAQIIFNPVYFANTEAKIQMKCERKAECVNLEALLLFGCTTNMLVYGLRISAMTSLPLTMLLFCIIVQNAFFAMDLMMLLMPSKLKFDVVVLQ